MARQAAGCQATSWTQAVPAAGIEPAPSRLQRDARPSSCTGMKQCQTQYPWQESNLHNFRLRRAACLRHTPGITIPRPGLEPGPAILREDGGHDVRGFHHQGMSQSSGAGIEPTPSGVPKPAVLLLDDRAGSGAYGCRSRTFASTEHCAEPLHQCTEKSGWLDLNQRSPASEAGGLNQALIHPDKKWDPRDSNPHRAG